uniref:Uncharacterized protein n=1 Tax=Caenorhabditis tropicalis TaxID=1561998 RepID=A0A1I7TNZ2_9PELO
MKERKEEEESKIEEIHKIKMESLNLQAQRLKEQNEEEGGKIEKIHQIEMKSLESEAQRKREAEEKWIRFIKFKCRVPSSPPPPRAKEKEVDHERTKTYQPTQLLLDFDSFLFTFPIF